MPKEFKAISLCASAKNCRGIAEAKLKIIESLRQLFAEAKIVELRELIRYELREVGNLICVQPALQHWYANIPLCLHTKGQQKPEKA